MHQKSAVFFIAYATLNKIFATNLQCETRYTLYMKKFWIKLIKPKDSQVVYTWVIPQKTFFLTPLENEELLCVD